MRSPVILAAGLSSVLSLFAQIVPDGAIRTLANVTNNIPGDVTVGTNGSFTLLELSDNALLINSLRGVIGRNATARSNEVRLISPTSRWEMNTLFVGSNGAFNRLVISNGAQVIGNSAGNSGIIGQTANSVSNLALVTGAGSLWSNAGALNIGSSGAGNQLVVSNGARVHAVQQTYVGLIGSSTNNRVTVTGAGSLWSSGGLNVGLNGLGNRLFVLAGGGVLDDVGEIGGLGGFNVVDVAGLGTFWTNTGSFQVGSGSAFNQLTVSDGAVVTAGNYGSVGGSSSSASLNTATVTDPGSMWLIDGDLYVGRDGPLNRLFVNNGGLVAATNLFVGFQPTATSNRVAVNGGTLRVTTAAGTGVLDIRRGTNVLNAGLIEVDLLRLANVLGKFEFNGGTLITRGAFITNGSGMNIGSAGGGSAFWDVRPGPSSHFVALGVVVGNSSPSNQLLVSGGALLTNNIVGFIGSAANGNAATVTGPGSRWQVGGQVGAGLGGAFNRLTVSDGGWLGATSGGLGGATSTASNNLAVVTGGGVWSNATSLIVGDTGPGNKLQISSGGRVVSTSGTLGQSATASANTVQVSDAGSEWRVAGNLDVGANGSFNRLVVSNGARISDFTASVGKSAGGSDNAVVITDSGSLWSNVGGVAIGVLGARNQLVVSNGATVIAPSGLVGENAGHNTAVVTGSGSAWRNEAVDIGFFGNSNRVAVQNGGLLVSDFGSLGGGGGFSNAVIVTGPGSVWNNRSDLTIGGFGRGNQLLVSNGGFAVSSNTFLGHASDASNNTVLVTGVGSVWSNRNELLVGSNSLGNRIQVRDGGSVFVNSSTTVGRNAQSVSNLVLVTDPGSVWSNTIGTIFELGFQGSGNRLVASNGGRMQLFSVLVGGGSTGEGNEAVLSGAGTVVDAMFFLLGNSGSRNRLRVGNGASLRSTGSSIGFNDLGRNNEALVADPGSSWASDRLVVGFSGSGSQLILTNGGTFLCPRIDIPDDRPEHALVLGETQSSTNNRVVVNGGLLQAANGNGTASLDVRRGTNVLNAGLIDVDVLLMTNTLGRFEFNGGTLVTRSAVISNNTTFTIGNAGSTPAVWDVRSGPNYHHVARAMFLGLDAPFAHLVHTNGALLTNSDFTFVGVDQASRSNRITLAGASSRWEMAGGIYVGDTSSDNRLTVTEGATIYSGKRIILGNDLFSDNNEAMISGSGSSWTTAGDVPMLIGSSGSSNRFILASAGQATHGVGLLGFRSSASNNLALITGAGSRWNILDELRVGGESAGNHLVVSNGAVLFTGGLGILGADTNASHNTAIVTGPGSQWLLNSNLFVGSNASLSTLVISNGGFIASPDGGLGIRPASSNNLAVVTGPGSQWILEETLQIGRNGPNNLMQAADGASVSTRNTSLGQGSGSSGNGLLVRGLGTVWTSLEETVVGISGSGNRLVVEAGARMESSIGTLGDGIASVGNEVVVSGTGSLWRNAGQIVVGRSGGRNQLIVTNGGVVISSSGALSGNSVARSNVVVVTGPGSMWSNSASLAINQGSGNQLVISDGGLVRSISGLVGVGSNASNSTVLVTGPGSEWINEFNLDVAQSGPGHHLVISNGGSVRVGGGLSLGSGTNAIDSRIDIMGGTLRSTNALGTAPYDIRRGTNLLNSGLVEADRLFLTNSQGFFEFNGGTLISRNSVIANGQPFRVGNGVSAATFQLRGNGTHDFALNGLSVSAEGALTGSGNVAGELVIQPGGLLSPGTPLGRLSLTQATPPTLLGTALMEISKIGGATSNDVIQTASSFVYGGAILVTNRGPDALAPGDRFHLFEASGFSGSLSNLVLPPLGAGLAWRTNLLVDGSIDVVSLAPPAFSGVTLAGTNVVIAGTNGPANGSYTVLSSTNVALPLSNWVSIATNVFDANGAFSFTNAIEPAIPQRFFQLFSP